MDDPGLIPRNLLADSPTMQSSNKPASLTIARNVNGGWSWSAGKIPAVVCPSHLMVTDSSRGTSANLSAVMSVTKLPDSATATTSPLSLPAKRILPKISDQGDCTSLTKKVQAYKSPASFRTIRQEYPALAIVRMRCKFSISFDYAISAIMARHFWRMSLGLTLGFFFLA